MARILHTSDLHFGRPAAAERLESLRESIRELHPDTVAVSGDLTQRCTHSEFIQARRFLDSIQSITKTIVVPGNHDIRWIGAVPRSLGLLKDKASDFKYSKYRMHISEDLNPSLEIPGAVIAGINTAHGISRNSMTGRLRDLGVIGHVGKQELLKAREAFNNSAPNAVRIIMIHHNPIKGSISGRHGLANTDEALESFADIGTELVLCGHDHQEAVHYVEVTEPGLVISTAGTISNRLRAGRPSSFNLVELTDQKIKIVTYTWQSTTSTFVPSLEQIFNRHRVSRPA